MTVEVAGSSSRKESNKEEESNKVVGSSSRKESNKVAGSSSEEESTRPTAHQRLGAAPRRRAPDQQHTNTASNDG